MPKQKTTIGRPPAEAAGANMVTIAQAADELGCTYATVYRHLDQVDFVKDAQSGVVSIPVGQLELIKASLRQPAKPADTRAVAIRPRVKTLKRWQKAIKAMTKEGEEPIAVSRWLQELADRAADKALGPQ